MQTRNVTTLACPPERAFDLARHVERWPDLLPHYRWVRFHRGGPEEGGLVEMAARREFGPLPWPLWWVSEMAVDPQALTIRYTHVRGVTRGMEVAWRIEPVGGGSRVTVWHRWAGGPRFCGPAAPLVGRAVVGPLFVHAVAERTLRALAALAEVPQPPAGRPGHRARHPGPREVRG